MPGNQANYDKPQSIQSPGSNNANHWHFNSTIWKGYAQGESNGKANRWCDEYA